jgi:ribosome assembly protein 1
MGCFFAGERMEEDLKWRETLEARLKAADKPKPESAINTGKNSSDDTPASEYEEKDDEDIYFAPEKHNVIFASAIDGWAFTIRQFAGIYEKKLGIKKSILEKVLWGDYYLDPKTKRVLRQKHLKGRIIKPMFVQLVLDNVWAVYESTVLQKYVFLLLSSFLFAIICLSIMRISNKYLLLAWSKLMVFSFLT